MNNVERAERALILDPLNLTLRAELIAEYRVSLAYSQERAECYCLSVWHPHAEAQEVTRVIRFMEPSNINSRPIALLIRAAACIPDGQTMKALITTGDVPPVRVPYHDRPGEPVAAVTVLVGAKWLLAEVAKMVSQDMTPHRPRPKRRRW